MTVVSISKYRDRETVQLLKSLTLVSEHLGGSVLVVYRDPDGSEQVSATGIFKRDASKALMAAMRISIALTKQEEAVRGRP